MPTKFTETPCRSLSSFLKEEQHGKETDCQALSETVFPVQQILILYDGVQSYESSCMRSVKSRKSNESRQLHAVSQTSTMSIPIHCWN